MDDLKSITTAIKAGYSLFYCQTHEMNRSVSNLIKEIDSEDLILWDLGAGKDPDEVLDLLTSDQNQLILIAKNFQWFLKDEYGAVNKVYATFFQNRSDSFTTVRNRKIFIIIGSDDFMTAIPPMLQRDFLSIEFGLPNTDEIESIYNGILNSAKNNTKFKTPKKDEKEAIIKAAKGMTKKEIENAFSMSIVSNKGKFCSQTVSDIRARDIEKTAGLKIGKYPQTFESLKGYNNVKKFTISTIKSPLAKGIILLGPPGCGKSHFCRCLGNEANLPVFELEMASLFGGLVGESEQLMKAAIDIIKVNAPCVLFVDEIEKSLAGVGGGQSGDGGTTKRSMAQFLKFLSDDRPEGLYVVATCNDIKSLPPEWIRAGRWDAVFFVDLPTKLERNDICKYYSEVYKNKDASKVDMISWSGAEIETVYRLANMMGTTLLKASNFVVPISRTMKTEIEGLRKWAEGNTIPATIEIQKKGSKKRLINL